MRKGEMASRKEKISVTRLLKIFNTKIGRTTRLSIPAKRAGSLSSISDKPKTLNKNRSIVKEMKARLNKEIVRILDEEDAPYIESGKFNIS